jgi:hypothetical protein
MAVFVSYSHRDVAFVKGVVASLRQRKLSIWIDEDELRPGNPWRSTAAEALGKCGAVAILLGAAGPTDTQMQELDVALSEQASRKIPVIPVLLPGMTKEAALKTDKLKFLTQNTWVTFIAEAGEELALDRFEWGITGSNPAVLRIKPPAAADPAVTTGIGAIEGAVDDLTSALTRNSISFVLGRGINRGGKDAVPSARDIANDLLNALQVVAEERNHFIPSEELVAAYYAIEKGDGPLETTVSSWIRARSTSMPPTYQMLASALPRLSDRPAVRGFDRQPQLIVTTNLDVSLERALLRAGVSFTRIVQHRNSSQVTINEYADVGVNGGVLSAGALAGRQSINVESNDELDNLIARHGRRQEGSSRTLKLGGMRGPFVYKFLGSADVQKSATLSSDQYYDTIAFCLTKQSIPEEIAAVLSNTCLVFLGCHMIDPDFRLTYQALLRTPMELNNERHYAIHQLDEASFSQAEWKLIRRIWTRLKEETMSRYKVRLIDSRPEDFLQQIHARLA